MQSPSKRYDAASIPAGGSDRWFCSLDTELKGNPMRLLSICAAAMLVRSLGGSDRTRHDPESAPLQGRLDAAMAITDLNKRDAALAAVAIDAAAGGDDEIAAKATGKMSNLNERDNAMATAALKLAG